MFPLAWGANTHMFIMRPDVGRTILKGQGFPPTLRTDPDVGGCIHGCILCIVRGAHGGVLCGHSGWGIAVAVNPAGSGSSEPQLLLLTILVCPVFAPSTISVFVGGDLFECLLLPAFQAQTGENIFLTCNYD